MEVKNMFRFNFVKDEYCNAAGNVITYSVACPYEVLTMLYQQVKATDGNSFYVFKCRLRGDVVTLWCKIVHDEYEKWVSFVQNHGCERSDERLHSGFYDSSHYFDVCVRELLWNISQSDGVTNLGDSLTRLLCESRMPHMFTIDQWIDRVVTLNKYRPICGHQREFNEEEIIDKVLLNNLKKKQLLWIIKYCGHDKPKTLDEFRKWFHRHNIDRA